MARSNVRAAIATAIAALVLAAVGWFAIPRARRALIWSLVTYDATPGEASPLPRPHTPAPPLAPAPRTRVILIDGLSASVAAELPAWNALCDRGLRAEVDVGFPTVSLAIEAELWTGLTQQQSGIVYRSDAPIVPPLADSIPAHVPSSIAIAESHGYIVRSLGFANALPAASATTPAKDADADTWDGIWRALADQSVASPAPLVFVHVLRVDTAGHKHGGASPEYAQAAHEADAILAELVAAAPDARWFALSDHGHIAPGGHGGEEAYVRRVTGCIAGPGIAPQRVGLVHLVDIARALADSTGTTLSPRTIGRPIADAIAAPIDADDIGPPIPTGPLALGIAIAAIGLAASVVVARKAGKLVWWTLPLWWPLAIALLVLLRGAPTLSMSMVYQADAAKMTVAWLPALALGCGAMFASARRLGVVRAVAAQVMLPLAAAAGALTAGGGWASITSDTASAVPHVTAWTSPVLALAGQSLLVAALGLLATLARQAFDRRARPEPPHIPA